jgi:GT2 family glycosyltransferase
MNKLISINILTYNGEKWIEKCIKSVLEQTYPNIEILVIDNASTDNTLEKIQNIKIIKNEKNLGFSAGHNIGIRESKGEYVIVLNQDIVLDKNFIQEIVNCFEKNEKIGSIQPKIYQFNNGSKIEIIDVAGFQFFKSGRIIDIGQGEEDIGQYDQLFEIFGADGAAPAYRRTALNSIKLKEEYFDEDFFCYAEDFDLAWRLNSKGWISVFEPKAILWHNRKSSKSTSGGWKEFRETRKSQSLWLRKISWRNTWFAFIKNLPLKSFFHPQFLKRQIKFGLYLLFFEPKVLLAKFEIIKLLPRMLKKRKMIMKNKK